MPSCDNYFHKFAFNDPAGQVNKLLPNLMAPPKLPVGHYQRTASLTLCQSGHLVKF